MKVVIDDDDDDDDESARAASRGRRGVRIDSTRARFEILSLSLILS